MAMAHRAGTAAEWTSADPYLGFGEMGIETDTNKCKIGDGLNKWSDLLYADPRSGVIRIDHQTLGIAAAQIDITIPDRDDLVKLEIWIRARDTSQTEIGLRINSLAGAVYDYQQLKGAATSIAPFAARAASNVTFGRIPKDNTSEANQWSSYIVEIPYPRTIGPWRSLATRGGVGHGTSTGDVELYTTNGWLRKGMKIDTVSLLSISGGSFMAATQVACFGWVDK